MRKREKSNEELLCFGRFREKKKIQKVRDSVGLCPLLSGPRKNSPIPLFDIAGDEKK